MFLLGRFFNIITREEEAMAYRTMLAAVSVASNVYGYCSGCRRARSSGTNDHPR
jgi:hypothetical protein